MGDSSSSKSADHASQPRRANSVRTRPDISHAIRTLGNFLTVLTELLAPEVASATVAARAHRPAVRAALAVRRGKLPEAQYPGAALALAVLAHVFPVLPALSFSGSVNDSLTEGS